MSGRLTSVDALRGFAAVWVFAYHVWNVFAPGLSPQCHPSDHRPLTLELPTATLVAYPFFAYGYAGVALFFVLSGFCIHLPQARRFHTTGSDHLQPKQFWLRRFWRLYPAYLASIVLGMGGLFAMKHPSHEILAFAGFDAAFLMALRPEAITLGPVYWTLWFEVQFYVMYPLLLLAARKLGFPKLGGLILAIQLLIAFVPVPDVLKPYASHTQWFFLNRLFEWYLGVWIAECFADRRCLSAKSACVLSGLAIVAAVALSHSPLLWPMHELMFAVASGAFLLCLLGRKPTEPFTSRPNFTVRILTWFGMVSYSLYLVHIPLLRMIYAAVVAIVPTWPEFWHEGLFLVLSLGCVPVVSLVWFNWFEKPFLKAGPTWKLKTAPAQLRRVPATAGV